MPQFLEPKTFHVLDMVNVQKNTRFFAVRMAKFVIIIYVWSNVVLVSYIFFSGNVCH